MYLESNLDSNVGIQKIAINLKALHVDLCLHKYTLQVQAASTLILSVSWSSAPSSLPIWPVNLSFSFFSDDTKQANNHRIHMHS